LSFLAVDHSLHLIEYGAVEWSQIRDADSPNFYPEFLHPIHSILAPDESCVHLTPHGDLILMNRNGLLAARCRRKWKLYDTPTFTDSLADCLGSAAVVANLLEVILELSFRRLGALLIYDPKHEIHGHIMNRESIVFSGWQTDMDVEAGTESGQAVIALSLRDLAIGENTEPSARSSSLPVSAPVTSLTFPFTTSVLPPMMVTPLLRGCYVTLRSLSVAIAFLLPRHTIMRRAERELA
jgi:hypothetical protein